MFQGGDKYVPYHTFGIRNANPSEYDEKGHISLSLDRVPVSGYYLVLVRTRNLMLSLNCSSLSWTKQVHLRGGAAVWYHADIHTSFEQHWVTPLYNKSFSVSRDLVSNCCVEVSMNQDCEGPNSDLLLQSFTHKKAGICRNNNNIIVVVFVCVW